MLALYLSNWESDRYNCFLPFRVMLFSGNLYFLYHIHTCIDDTLTFLSLLHQNLQCPSTAKSKDTWEHLIVFHLPFGNCLISVWFYSSLFFSYSTAIFSSMLIMGSFCPVPCEVSLSPRDLSSATIFLTCIHSCW